MRARVRPIAAVAALALVVWGTPRGTQADDPPQAPPAKATYTVLIRERWKAGDVATRTVRETVETNVEEKHGDEAAKKRPKYLKLSSYVAVLQCLEADVDGYATKLLVYLTAWSIEVGAVKDSCLAGVHVEVAGKGAERTWKILTPDFAPSKAATAWIEQNFGKIASGDATNADLEPAGPVEIGATWSGNALAIAKRVAERGLPIDVEKAKASVTLLGVDGGRIHAKEVISFPMTELVDVNGQQFAWKEGGIVEMTVDLVRPLLAGSFDAKLHLVQHMGGVAQAQNALLTREDDLTRDIEITTGGKMPAVPTVPAGSGSTDVDKKEPAMGDGK